MYNFGPLPIFFRFNQTFHSFIYIFLGFSYIFHMFSKIEFKIKIHIFLKFLTIYIFLLFFYNKQQQTLYFHISSKFLYFQQNIFSFFTNPSHYLENIIFQQKLNFYKCLTFNHFSYIMEKFIVSLIYLFFQIFFTLFLKHNLLIIIHFC